MAIGKDIHVNINLMCGSTFDSDIFENEEVFLQNLDKDPCHSAAALLTLLTIQEKPIPRNPKEQEELVKQTTSQIIISYSDILARVSIFT